jgi:aryl sulfotransferase
MTDSIEWPVKTREIHDAYFDSSRWNGFPFRDGDVVIATFPHVGTTWTQEIVRQLIQGAPSETDPWSAAPWLDMRINPFKAVMEILEGQTHRRSIKTHLPLDAIVFSPKARYIVVGRDARDMVWSIYRHQELNDDRALALFNGPPGRPGRLVSRPDRDIRDYYLHFLETGDLPGFGFEPFWPHIAGWWSVRRLPNVLMLHYANLRADLPGEIGRIADFLEIAVDEAELRTIVEHCSFDYMRTNCPPAGRIAFNKGVNGRWKNVLSPSEAALCDEVAARNLPPECAHWLATGELAE